MSKFDDLDVLDSKEAAEYLRVNIITLRRMIKRGELSGKKIGGQYRFLKKDLEKFISGKGGDSRE